MARPTELTDPHEANDPTGTTGATGTSGPHGRSVPHGAATELRARDAGAPSVGDLGGGEPSGAERRVHPRRSVSAMYSLVEAKPLGGTGLPCSGHVYDVSLGGVRVELDEHVAPGTELELALHLPSEPGAIRARGTVTRVYDADDDPVCRRAGVRFERFDDASDELRLRRFLGAETASVRRAA